MKESFQFLILHKGLSNCFYGICLGYFCWCFVCFWFCVCFVCLFFCLCTWYDKIIGKATWCRENKKIAIILTESGKLTLVVSEYGKVTCQSANLRVYHLNLSTHSFPSSSSQSLSLTCHYWRAIVLHSATNTIIPIHTTTDKARQSLIYMSCKIYPPIDRNTSLPVVYQECDSLIP